jgi:hypothetical protein
MERKKVVVTKENLVMVKKITRNQLASLIIQSILEKNHQVVQRVKKILLLKERKNLKAGVTDLKTLPLKNIVKKELRLKIF